MSAKPLEGQLQLSMFSEPRRTPTWDDVHNGTAELVDVIEPCDRCDACWHGGRCTHTSENYAFPKYREGGMCLKHRIVWKA